ncbi:hypothetical protein [Leptolyngbya sp. KIOST-1]|uniref:hypothetical protein n=1 Tax=Leptolyngbya sp. KIOST-1 TaxID=1229172 RepID=UPI00056D1734|nr:hypothetical protein [Leptolyngbya sp. KIOST-1]
MTDTTASSASPEPQDLHFVTDDGAAADAQPLAQVGDQAGDWETVPLPGQLPLADVLAAEGLGPEGWEPSHLEHLELENLENEATVATPPEPHRPSLQGNDLMAAAQVGASVNSVEPAPEDLVQLIQDLNQCNDALLLRVTELEEDLERSQVALQAEIERNQAQPHRGSLPLEATPGPVQQQIAQLLSELDIANDGLRRTTIHNETLQAELEVSQQRVAQLERECTLLQQRFSEKNTALHQAEETCRDLKARLHRQQRYTLQFKAALEKCLNMAPGAAATSPSVVQGQLLGPSAAEEPGAPVALPRSPQIQPWSARSGSLADNPSLTHLLRGLRGVGPTPVQPAAPQRDRSEAPLPLLDLAETPSPAAPVPFPPEPEPMPAPAPAVPQASRPAPDPWLEEPVASEAAASDPWEKPATPEPAMPEPAAPESLFTEPSPWGEPIAPPAAPTAPPVEPEPLPPVHQAPVVQAPIAARAAVTAPASVAPSLPSYLTASASAKASPSPLVYPLRSQKKIKSIAAVELPSFGRTVRRR